VEQLPDRVDKEAAKDWVGAEEWKDEEENFDETFDRLLRARSDSGVAHDEENDTRTISRVQLENEYRNWKKLMAASRKYSKDFEECGM
jgi:hypothetical protein